MAGLFFTFEGGEGCGKSSASKSLGRWLYEKFGIVPVLTREPGGTKIGEEIREILLNKKVNLDPFTEAFLFQAARAQLVSEIIKPSLLQRRIVIVDRFADSSIAYQGGARGLGVKTIKDLNDLSTRKIVPDLTFLLDLDPEIGLTRKKGKENLNRIDSESPNFQERVRYAYLREAGEGKSGRWIVVDASASEEKINKAIQGVVESKLKQTGFLERMHKGKER